MSVNIHEFWADNYYNHPPLTDAMIEYAEKKLKVKLPDKLIDLLKIQNGGYTKGFVFPMTQATSWADDHLPLSELYGIVPGKDDSAQNIMDTAYMTEEWGLPEKQVILCSDGHWWITLDYRKSDIPCVSWIDTECNEDIRIAGSFTEFLNNLVREEDFTTE